MTRVSRSSQAETEPLLYHTITFSSTSFRQLDRFTSTAISYPHRARFVSSIYMPSTLWAPSHQQIVQGVQGLSHFADRIALGLKTLFNLTELHIDCHSEYLPGHISISLHKMLLQSVASFSLRVFRDNVQHIEPSPLPALALFGTQDSIINFSCCMWFHMQLADQAVKPLFPRLQTGEFASLEWLKFVECRQLERLSVALPDAGSAFGDWAAQQGGVHVKHLKLTARTAGPLIASLKVLVPLGNNIFETLTLQCESETGADIDYLDDLFTAVSKMPTITTLILDVRPSPYNGGDPYSDADMLSAMASCPSLQRMGLCVGCVPG